VQAADGRVTHHEWLAEGPEDPRPMLAERLVRACESARTVVASNASFERRLAAAAYTCCGGTLTLENSFVEGNTPERCVRESA